MSTILILYQLLSCLHPAGWTLFIQASTTSDAVTALYVCTPEPSEPEMPISGQNVSSVPRVLYTEGKNHPALWCFSSLWGDSSKETALTDCLCWITVHNIWRIKWLMPGHTRQTNTAKEERHILGRKGRLDCKEEREAKKEKQNSKGQDLWASRATAGQETGL